ncbi:MAG: LCP family protein [Lachnospiraceae bacterium]|nr:LCP family protein [Lachnospiraceae bacterium]
MDIEKNQEQEPLTDNTVPKNHGRKKKKKKISRGVIIAILSFFALVIGAGVYLINHYLNQIDIIDPATESVLSPSEFAQIDSEYWQSINDPNYTVPDPDATETDNTESPDNQVVKVVREAYQPDAYRATLSADDELVIFDHPVTPTVVNQSSSGGGLHDEDLINIMLVGQDTRNSASRTRSDSMILVSINPKTHKVALISFLRDLYVPIGDGYGWNRLNTAFQIGGLQKMYKVFESVFGLHIDGGIYVNFGQFMTLVNLLGGVDVTLTSTEAKWLRTTIEQSIPDMRYWGQIVEAKMPKIKTGTTVKAAISALTNAKLSYAYADANGGAAPEDLSTATVKGLYLNAAGTKTAKAYTYYPLQTTIYIKYTENRSTFPTIPENSSVESVVKLLTNNGFKVAYADKNGNTAPYDSKSALVTGVYKEAAGKNSFVAGEKYDKNTTAYIAYVENSATVPTIPEGTTVADAESMLRAAGLGIAWSSLNDGTAPADKTKAKVTGIWLDQAATKQLHAGDKLDINTTVYISYELIEESTDSTEPTEPTQPTEATQPTEPTQPTQPTQPTEPPTEPPTQPTEPPTEPSTEPTQPATEEPTEPATEEPTQPATEEPTQCSHDYTNTQWTSNNNGTHSGKCSNCGETKTESCEYTEIVQNATCTEAGSKTTKCSKCGYVKSTEQIPATGHKYNWTSNNNGTHTGKCSSCGGTKTEDCSYDSNGKCTKCNYVKPTQAPTEAPTEAPTQENSEGNSFIGDGSGAQITFYSAPKELYNPIVSPMATRTSSSSSSEPYYLRNIKAGRVHLDGMQTLAYCRMRKLDSDVKRAERQRTVLNILFNKVKNSSISTLNNLLEQMLPQVKTDLSKAEILKIAANVLPYFSSINLQLHSIPADGTYSFATISGKAVVTMNQAANINALRYWMPLN